MNAIHRLGCFAGTVVLGGLASNATDYDPLATPAGFVARHLDLTVHDADGNRDLPIRVYLPPATNQQPVVLFSHGLGGNRAGSAFPGEHWAARGYVAVFLQHPGSDDSVWKDAPLGQRFGDLAKVASLKNFMLRVRDVPAVLNKLTQWNTEAASPFAGRLDMTKIGMSGHSFGAVTTQAVSGEDFPVNGRSLTDPRIKAAVIFSPSTPKRGRPEKAFGTVTIPWMLMTGTHDLAPIGDVDTASRLGVYTALRGSPKYEVVLNNAEHSVFTDRPLAGDHEPRNPNHHRVIEALSTAFWDAYLRGDAAALKLLNGAGPRSIMEAKDEWQSSP